MSPRVRLPVVLDSPRVARLSDVLSPKRKLASPSRPSYLRVVVNAVCPLACSFCHREGDPAVPGRERGLSTTAWTDILIAAVDAGIRKVKFLGGEPLLRIDLPEIVRAVHRHAPSVDLSVITSGVVPSSRLDALYEAGLTRCNVSIHGFGLDAFLTRTRSTRAAWSMRNAFLERAIELGRPLKVNYVYTGPADESDLAALLDFAAPRRLLVSVLDDLTRSDLDASSIERLVHSIRGSEARRLVCDDPHSLPTTHLVYDDGLVIELKDSKLGEQSPWLDCADCSVRHRCREGIRALRVGHTGDLRPCMDRPDLAVPLWHPDDDRTVLRRTIEAFLDAHTQRSEEDGR